MTRSNNLILFVTDNHASDFLGVAGHSKVQTPNLDRLATRGVQFQNAYAATTLCCPSRAAMATGRYPHQTGYWDNATMYDGKVETWHHRLRDAQVPVTAIGKLHYRSAEDDNGFSEEIHTMHVVDGIGSPLTLLRGTDEGVPTRGGHKAIYGNSGPGQTDYQIYDRQITERAIDWLRENAGNPDPWVLIVSYPSPHPPFCADQENWALYPPEDMPLPPTWDAKDRYDHPAMAYLARMNQLPEGLDESFARNAYAGYCALITQTDAEIGKVIDTADDLGLIRSTRMIYTSDHGEAICAHGILGKANLYEHSAGVPLIMAGPGVPQGKKVADCVSHVDLFPTMLDLFDLPTDKSLTGQSLLRAIDGSTEERPAFSEYHAMGSLNSSFMIRSGNWKLIYHVGMRNQLFDLANDPHEGDDLLANERTHPKEAKLVALLRDLVDPEALDTRSKADQRARIEELGGLSTVKSAGSIAASPIPGKEVNLEKI
ncbi:sulfatase-like hydrolase/transferase [Ruegeria sp. Ofav3-42]|uniref:sulfatase-like hydrolase/transferase n=1 Tax=Ruegeria sp. Ofav3-42 TaxID=2917759 RepID=UPI001EF550E5|nr:sulfatase-like hydrolase/transferase [Ruegeria sp. Ofav3-42]MCG7522834.1 sulfatase-like hydrolase/transferase [Ruegeria sp. Ofav3-42]